MGSHARTPEIRAERRLSAPTGACCGASRARRRRLDGVGRGWKAVFLNSHAAKSGGFLADTK